MESLFIIIPAYNEEKRIWKTLAEYSAYFDAHARAEGFSYSLFVVINNTTDRTEEIVREAQRYNANIQYVNLPHGGKGYAVVEGFNLALRSSADYIGFVDADMSTRPEEYLKLARNLSHADCVIASRYLPGAVVNPKPTIQRIIASRAYNALIRSLLMTPYRDTQCGAKLFRREVIECILPFLSMSEWAFDIDLLYHARKQGFHIREIPTVWSDSEYSKINFKRAGFRMALAIVRLRLINSPFRRAMRLYDYVTDLIPYR